MKVRQTVFFLLTALPLAVAACRTTDGRQNPLVIVENGKSDYRIVLPDVETSPADLTPRNLMECAKLLQELSGVPEQQRTARFLCAMCYIDATGDAHSFLGKVEGIIGMVPEGENGFGYDPVFRYQGKSFAVLTAEEKNAVSHRADALRQVYGYLEQERGTVC